MMDLLQNFSDHFFENGALSALIATMVIVVLALVVLRVVHRIFNSLVEKERIDATAAAFIRRIFSIVIWILAIAGIAMQIKPFRQFVVSFLASSGIIVVVLTFAAKEAMGNVVSGMFLSFFRPFKIGDRINLMEKNIAGIVEDISLRHTVIRTFENNRVIVPNSVVNMEILENANFEEDKVCRFLDISVGYNSDIEKAMDIIAQQVRSHKNFYDNRSQEEIEAGAKDVAVRVLRLGSFSVDLRATVWAKSAGQAYDMCCDLNLSIKKRFDEEGIEIPYPYQNVIVKKEQDLSENRLQQEEPHETDGRK